MTNIDICNKFMDTFNAADWDTNAALMSDNVTYNEYATGRNLRSKGAWLEASQQWKVAFPNANGTIRNTLEAGNVVIQEITWAGTNTGEMLTPDGQKIPPTGKSMETHATWILTLENGKITQANHYFDMLGMMAQLGLAG
mgnify:CR=1 FL=1